MDPLMKEILRMRSKVRQHIAGNIRELKYSRIHHDWTTICRLQKAADTVVELASNMGMLRSCQVKILTDEIYKD